MRILLLTYGPGRDDGPPAIGVRVTVEEGDEPGDYNRTFPVELLDMMGVTIVEMPQRDGE